MAQQFIQVGAQPDDGGGDTARAAGQKINDNFTELYAAVENSIRVNNPDAAAARDVLGLGSSALTSDDRVAYGNSSAVIAPDARVVALNAVLTAPRTLTLPPANAVGSPPYIIVVDEARGVSSINTLTIQRAGSDTINGTATPIVFNTPGSAVVLVRDGSSAWTSVQSADQWTKAEADARYVINRGEATPSNITVSTLTAALGLTFPASVQNIQTLGFAAVNDGGARLMTRVAANPGAGGARSVDRFLPNGTVDNTNGGWWALSDATINTRMFGCGAADDTTAFTEFMTLCAAGRRAGINSNVNLTAGVSVTQTASASLRGISSSVVSYVAVPHIQNLITINQAGFGVDIEGELGFAVEGNNRVARGLEVRNSTTTEAPRSVVGVTVRNVRAINSTFSEANGIFIAGTASLERVRDNRVINCTRAAGIAGGVCQGIVVTYLTGPNRNPRHIECEGNYVENVTSDDAAGAGWDFDGIVLFQLYDATSTSCKALGNTTREARGRAMKVFAPNPVIKDTTIYRSIAGGSSRTTEIACQTGSGTVENTTVYYTGIVVHNHGTDVVTFYTDGVSGVLSPPLGGIRRVKGVSINDASTGGNIVSAAVDLSYGNPMAAVAGNYLAEVSGIRSQQKQIRSFLRVNNNGTASNRSTIKLEDAFADLNFAVAECDSALPNIDCTLINVTNPGTTRPVMRRTDLVALNGVHGQWRGSGVVGVQRSTGDATPAIPGFAPMDATYEPNSSVWHGRSVLFAQSVAAGATLTFDIGAPCMFDIHAPGDVGNATIFQRSDNAVTKDSGGSAVVVGTGSEPGTGDLRVWSTSTNSMNFKNATGAAMFVTVIMSR